MIEKGNIEPMFYNFDFENIKQNMIYMINTKNTKKIIDINNISLYYLVDYDTTL